MRKKELTEHGSAEMVSRLDELEALSLSKGLAVCVTRLARSAVQGGDSKEVMIDQL